MKLKGSQLIIAKGHKLKATANIVGVFLRENIYILLFFNIFSNKLIIFFFNNHVA